jgi:glycosyltransferase involved in cell wall biosynthesis
MSYSPTDEHPGRTALRVLHIITDLNVGGAEIMLSKLLSVVDRSHVEPSVISLLADGELSEGIRSMGITVESLGMRRGLPNPIDLVRLAQRIRHRRPHVVQTWMYHADLLGGMATRLASRAPLVWGLHNSDLDKQRTKRSTRLVARLCARLSHSVPNRIISCSRVAVPVHAKLGYDAEKFIVIPNGFDTDAFLPDSSGYAAVREELGVPADALLVGMVARFDPQKDHRNFVEAAGRVGARFPNAHFVLVGTGCDQANGELLAWIAGTGIAERFHLLGLRRDVPRLTTALDVATTSSAFGEAFPLVIGESMCCGVPCVVTDVGDSALIVGDTGRVVPPRNAAALADGIGALLALSPEGRRILGEAARARILANFALPNVAALYQAVYDALYAG